jgi:excisionase family DNA binding protein
MSRKGSSTPAKSVAVPKLSFRVLTLEQAFEALGGAIPLRTLRFWIEQGRLKYYRPGKRVLIDADSLENLVLGSRRVAINAPAAEGG